MRFTLLLPQKLFEASKIGSKTENARLKSKV